MKPILKNIDFDASPDSTRKLNEFLNGGSAQNTLSGEQSYLKHKRNNYALQAFLGLATTAGIFLLLPFTQMISSLGRDNTEIVQVEIEITPPPPPDLELDQPDPPPPPPPPPDMSPPPQRVSLDSIDASLNLGTGTASGIAVFEGFNQSADDTANDLSIFNINDLDGAPAFLRSIPLVYPPNLKRARVTGYVILEVIIDERGKAHVEAVKEARIREFIEPATNLANAATFEIPKKNGKAVRVRYDWKINFSL